jgi:hypothetical protein
MLLRILSRFHFSSCGRLWVFPTETLSTEMCSEGKYRNPGQGLKARARPSLPHAGPGDARATTNTLK